MSEQAPADRPLLTVEGLTVTQQRTGHTLVRDVDLSIGRGQTLGVVGESGSGKSLSVRSVVGLLPDGLRATGQVRYDGIDLLPSSEQALRAVRGPRISLLLQDPFSMLNPLQTAGTHVEESLPAGRFGTRRERRAEIGRRLAEVGLDPDVAGRYPFELSGGMRQRVALTAALARDPELLIADEPTTALDVTTQDEVLELLRTIQESRGMSLILITHDLRVAFSVCDEIQVMYAGTVVERAKASALRAAPLHPYSLGLMLSEPPVDRYVATLTSIPGNVPPVDAVHNTCAFADRCDWVLPTCRDQHPPLLAVAPGRDSACRRTTEIAGELSEGASGFSQEAAVRPQPQVGQAILNITDIRKTFRSSGLGRRRVTTALRGVSLQVAAGESVGLVGETGSGKTTIARSVLGLNRIDSGRIDLGDIDVSRGRRYSREERRKLRHLVQVVFQDPYASLNPAKTIGATLREAAMLAEDPSATIEAGELLAAVGLPADYAPRHPAALSGGERQRVAIARAVALRPRLLICDEPVAALDVSAQAQVLEVLRDIHRRSHTAMLFITHDLSVVRQMTDRLVVLYRGEVVETGDSAEVLDNPQHAYTQRLVAATPGNREVGASPAGALTTPGR